MDSFTVTEETIAQSRDRGDLNIPTVAMRGQYPNVASAILKGNSLFVEYTSGVEERFGLEPEVLSDDAWVAGTYKLTHLTSA